MLEFLGNVAVDIVGILVFLFLLTLVICNRKQESINSKKIIFDFTKPLKVITIFGSVTIIFILVINILLNNDIDIIPFVTLLVFALAFIIFYAYIKLKVIVYEDGVFTVTGLFKKKQQYKITDIECAIEKPQNKMILKLKNNKQFSIDVQMNNYDTLKELLDKNKIKY